jgi:tRNA-binding protein
VSVPDRVPAPVKPTITLADLEKVDIRVGTIVAVEDLAAAAKLVRLRVDFGDHTRGILAGLKTERSDVRELEGRQALFVVNLAPKKMAGELSEGMLFDIGYTDGISPALAVPERPVPAGSRAVDAGEVENTANDEWVSPVSASVGGIHRVGVVCSAGRLVVCLKKVRRVDGFVHAVPCEAP